jgi:V/A-type H+-transporting ATPase subunit D
MAKIKHTKNELKAQSEALARFERFLPMLQLKKQQLQAEIQSVDAGLAENERQDDALRSNLGRWIRLFSEPAGLEELIALEDVRTEEGNIAGVNIRTLANVVFRKAEPDLFDTPTWIDEGTESVERLTRLRVDRELLREQRRRIAEELRITTQRVNLFEKVKIPECRENIRVIKIFLGDEQTAAVVRGKIAKRRVEASAEIAVEVAG